MEYGSLHDLLRNETMYLSGEIILQIARDVAQGLRYLHTAKPPIQHGDLKPANILVDNRYVWECRTEPLICVSVLLINSFGLRSFQVPCQGV